MEFGTVYMLLDLVLKAGFLAGFLYMIYVLRDLDELVRSAENVTSSMESAAETLDGVGSVVERLEGGSSE